MNLLVNESPLLLLPTLARIMGLNEAVILQQLHYKLLNSPLKGGGFTWYFHTYAKWQEQFPFWSERTISRIFLNLENQGLIVSTQDYNALRVNKTKWYRIDYGVLYAALKRQNVHNYPQDLHLQPTEPCGVVPQDLAASDLKELKKEEIKKNNVDFVFEVIQYLNQKTNKAFRAKNNATKRLINGRLAEGYELEDFKKVIDRKVAQWLKNHEMRQYLRPSTLFSATNFENYLNESTVTKPFKSNTIIQPIVLDYEAGEEDD